MGVGLPPSAEPRRVLCLSTQLPPNASCHAILMIKSEGWHAKEKNIAELICLLEGFLFGLECYFLFSTMESIWEEFFNDIILE